MCSPVPAREARGSERNVHISQAWTIWGEEDSIPGVALLTSAPELHAPGLPEGTQEVRHGRNSKVEPFPLFRNLMTHVQFLVHSLCGQAVGPQNPALTGRILQ